MTEREFDAFIRDNTPRPDVTRAREDLLAANVLARIDGQDAMQLPVGEFVRRMSIPLAASGALGAATSAALSMDAVAAGIGSIIFWPPLAILGI